LSHCWPPAPRVHRVLVSWTDTNISEEVEEFSLDAVGDSCSRLLRTLPGDHRPRDAPTLLFWTGGQRPAGVCRCRNRRLLLFLLFFWDGACSAVAAANGSTRIVASSLMYAHTRARRVGALEVMLLKLLSGRNKSVFADAAETDEKTLRWESALRGGGAGGGWRRGRGPRQDATVRALTVSWTSGCTVRGLPSATSK
jgi:hypothetical protein